MRNLAHAAPRVSNDADWCMREKSPVLVNVWVTKSPGCRSGSVIACTNGCLFVPAVGLVVQVLRVVLGWASVDSDREIENRAVEWSWVW